MFPSNFEWLNRFSVLLEPQINVTEMKTVVLEYLNQVLIVTNTSKWQ